MANKLKDMSNEEKIKLYEDLNSNEYGNIVEAIDKLAEIYNVSRRTMYGWKNKLAKVFEVPVKEEEYLYVKGKSTLTDAEGNVKMQWVKEDTDRAVYHRQMEEALDGILTRVEGLAKPTPAPVGELFRGSMNVYVCNDLHMGGLMVKDETGDRDWNNEIALNTIKSSIDHLVTYSPNTEECLVTDLGDLLEMDDFKNATPHSGNQLDVDGIYSQVMSIAMEAIIYMIEKCLEKHQTVYFLNVAGNHDITSGHAIRTFVSAWYRNEPRVIVHNGISNIKYHQFGSTLLGFAHGDGLKMKDAGEVMACDNEEAFSSTKNRYFHFGHNHKDSVVDGRLCKSESHRNLAPLNGWAAHKGYRRQAGTMKCITYHQDKGEINRNTYIVSEED